MAEQFLQRAQVGTAREQMSREAAIFVGRKTFEEFRGYWPAQRNDKTGITAHLNKVRKYVLSRTLEDPQWENTEILRGDIAEEVERLKQRVQGEIGVTGSITLVHALIEARLVDEYRLFLYPVTAGRGRKMFEEATRLGSFKLREAKSFRSGVVLLTYQPDRDRA